MSGSRVSDILPEETQHLSPGIVTTRAVNPGGDDGKATRINVLSYSASSSGFFCC